MEIYGGSGGGSNFYDLIYTNGSYLNKFQNLYLGYAENQGISLRNSGSTLVENCYVEYCSDAGIELWESDNVTITDCYINRCVNGIEVGSNSDKARITNNYFYRDNKESSKVLYFLGDIKSDKEAVIEE